MKMKNIGLGDESSPEQHGAGAGLDVPDENAYLKRELTEMHHKLREYADEVPELVEFNKELQWTLMMMKQENEKVKEELEFLANGGTKKEWEEKQLKQHFNPETSPEKFQSPRADN